MPWLVVGDAEAMELLDSAAEMASAALAARSRRIDEDNVFRRSVDMSRIKLETLRSNMHQSPMAAYGELEAVDRDRFLMLVRAFAAQDGENERAVLFEQIRTIVIRPGPKESFTGGQKPWADADLSAPRMAGPAKAASKNPSAVRRVRKKNRDGNSSPHSFD